MVISLSKRRRREIADMPARERLDRYLLAQEQGDEVTAQTLIETCPRVQTQVSDPRFTRRVEILGLVAFSAASIVALARYELVQAIYMEEHREQYASVDIEAKQRFAWAHIAGADAALSTLSRTFRVSRSRLLLHAPGIDEMLDELLPVMPDGTEPDAGTVNGLLSFIEAWEAL